MKVLILCNDFPPLNSIGAQRPYSWYRYLKQYGIEPVVITKNWKGHSLTPEEVLKNAGDNKIVIEESEYGMIIRVPLIATIPENLLLKYGENKFKYYRKALTLIYQLMKWISLSFDHHRNILKEADKYLSTNKVDGIVITGEPFILFKYGFLLHKKYNIPWIADFRDGWYLNYTVRQHKNILYRIIRKWEYFFEKKYISTCNLILSIDPILSEELFQLHKKPYEFVYNGYDEFYNGISTPTAHPPLVLTHSGTLTPSQQAEMLLQSVKELIDEKKILSSDIIINFIGLEYFPNQYKRIKGFNGLPEGIIYTSKRLPRESVHELNASADFLLIFTDPEYKWISAKAYDYISVKRPVLVIPDDNSIMSGFISKLNAGVIIKNKAELKLFLLDKLKMKKDGMKISHQLINIKEAITFTREKQAEILAGVLKKTFKK